jgi:AraC-like DNA-binding protein
MTRESVRHQVFTPSTALLPFVKRFEFTQSFTKRSHTLLPDTSLVACFRLDGVASFQGEPPLPMAILSGLQDSARSITHMPGSHVLLAVFTETGAAAFLRTPVDPLFNQTMPMDCLLKRPRLGDLHNQLTDATAPAHRIEVLERFIAGELRNQTHDRMVQAVAGHIKKTHGAVRIEDLATATGLSLSALERRFRKRVGTSPRKFASIVRMRHALKLRKSGGDFTEIAHEAGYFDQSHFCKDFKTFTGLAPQSFFREFSSFC